MGRLIGSYRILVAWAIAASAAGLFATPQPASAVLRTFELVWTSPGSAAAKGTMTLDDAACTNPGPNSLMFGPPGCFVELSFEIMGATAGNGKFSLVDFSDVIFNTAAMIDYDLEVIGQAPSDINFFGMAPAPNGVAPFVMFPAGGSPGDDLTLVSMAPIAFPFESDEQKCADAIGKAGASYFAARHKALQACRTGLMKGNPLFEDKAKTTPVQLASGCPDEFKSSSKIAKARQKVRSTLEKKCSDAVVAALPTCGATLDALADATGATGCLIESIDGSVADVLFDEFGF